MRISEKQKIEHLLKDLIRKLDFPWTQCLFKNRLFFNHEALCEDMGVKYL